MSRGSVSQHLIDAAKSSNIDKIEALIKSYNGNICYIDQLRNKSITQITIENNPHLINELYHIDAKAFSHAKEEADKIKAEQEREEDG